MQVLFCIFKYNHCIIIYMWTCQHCNKKTKVLYEQKLKYKQKLYNRVWLCFRCNDKVEDEKNTTKTKR